jgi:hypothetical protein
VACSIPIALPLLVDLIALSAHSRTLRGMYSYVSSVVSHHAYKSNLQGQRQARLSIAIDADRSQIRRAQSEELADLELGDVLGGKTLSPRYLKWMRRIAIGMEIPLA